MCPFQVKLSTHVRGKHVKSTFEHHSQTAAVDMWAQSSAFPWWIRVLGTERHSVYFPERWVLSWSWLILDLHSVHSSVRCSFQQRLLGFTSEKEVAHQLIFHHMDEQQTGQRFMWWQQRCRGNTSLCSSVIASSLARLAQSCYKEQFSSRKRHASSIIAQYSI